MAKDKNTEKNNVSAHAAAAKYNLWRPTDTKIHHDLELSYSPHTAVFREHECRTVVGPINTKGPQRQKPRTKNTRRLQTNHKKTTKKTQKMQKNHKKTTTNGKKIPRKNTKKRQKKTTKKKRQKHKKTQKKTQQYSGCEIRNILLVKTMCF